MVVSGSQAVTDVLDHPLKSIVAQNPFAENFQIVDRKRHYQPCRTGIGVQDRHHIPMVEHSAHPNLSAHARDRISISATFQALEGNRKSSRLVDGLVDLGLSAVTRRRRFEAVVRTVTASHFPYGFPVAVHQTHRKSTTSSTRSL
jgi:hypothetical protein